MEWGSTNLTAIVDQGSPLGLATQAADARVAAVVLAGGAGALYFAQSAYWSVSADSGVHPLAVFPAS